MGVAAGNALPKNSLVVSLETSRELPGVKMEQGVILRVGDRTSIFDSQAMRFLAEVASGLKTKNKKFQYQRALMSGGTCEATAYQEFGFQTAAVCVALGNYHNCGERKRIAAEFVSMADALGMVELLAAGARQMPRLPKLITEHDDGRSSRTIIFIRDHAAQARLHSQSGVIAAGNSLAVNDLRLIANLGGKSTDGTEGEEIGERAL